MLPRLRPAVFQIMAIRDLHAGGELKTRVSEDLRVLLRLAASQRLLGDFTAVRLALLPNPNMHLMWERMSNALNYSETSWPLQMLGAQAPPRSYRCGRAIGRKSEACGSEGAVCLSECCDRAEPSFYLYTPRHSAVLIRHHRTTHSQLISARGTSRGMFSTDSTYLIRTHGPTRTVRTS